jgi:hypothetical protein
MVLQKREIHTQLIRGDVTVGYDTITLVSLITVLDLLDSLQ